MDDIDYAEGEILREMERSTNVYDD